MRIKEVNSNAIIFDNGNTIEYDHNQDCCEWNYADFEQLDDLARNTDFDENLEFKALEDEGFMFGNSPDKMFFVPCYSEQNGYYSSDIEIYYKGKEVLCFNCEEVDG